MPHSYYDGNWSTSEASRGICLRSLSPHYPFQVPAFETSIVYISARILSRTHQHRYRRHRAGYVRARMPQILRNPQHQLSSASPLNNRLFPIGYVYESSISDRKEKYVQHLLISWYTASASGQLQMRSSLGLVVHLRYINEPSSYITPLASLFCSRVLRLRGLLSVRRLT